MKYSLSQKNIIVIAISVVLILSLGRLAKSHFDSSYFIVAGSAFVDNTKTPTPIIVQPGQGYDGQFFYRYALNPFDLNKDALGVHIDHPPYRAQRIAYPFFAWLISFGGNAQLVPWSMLLLNILAFVGIFIYTNKFISFVNGDIKQGLLPLFLCGIYMSLSHDLSEVVELFLFTGSVYYMFTSGYAWFCVYATLTILTRETSMICLFPLALCMLLRRSEEGKRAPALVIIIPFLVFAAWKLIIYHYLPSTSEAAVGYSSISIPFKGIIDGFTENFIFSDTKHILQFLFWIAYLLWTVWLVTIVLKNISFKTLSKLEHIDILKIAYLSWLLFSVCFSDNIYGDDWGFERIFSLWSMLGFLILIVSKKRTGRLFNSFSVLLVLLTIARLIIRV
jgi:hypothetical protein